MQKAFRIGAKEGLLVICHCEDKSLSKEGVVNLGFTSTRMGLRGISKESEYLRVARDLRLAAQEEARIHIAHVSCRESVELIAEAKKKGVKVSAETAPHYFSLSEEAVLGFDTNMKMNPPLRSKSDLASIAQALKDGVIDVISSDHAPHTESEKDIEFERAEFGVIGLETELSVGITYLVDTGILSWSRLIECMSSFPARILGINKGALTPGQDADIIIVSPEKDWVAERKDFISKSKNSPFMGRKLKGVVEAAILKGQVIYKR
jgi:dihydroorotase